MNHISLLRLLCAFTAMAFAAHPVIAGTGPKETITKEFTISGFDRVNIGSAFIIHVTKGENFKVTASGEQELVDDVKAELKNNELVVAFQENVNRVRLGRNTVTIEVVMPVLRGVNFGGTSSSTVKGFESSNFVAYIAGTAKSKIDIIAKEIFVDISGTASVELTGSAESLKTFVTGVAGLQAFNFPVKTANLEVTGTSSARVNVSETINAKASGTSTIRYKGSAKTGSLEIARLSSFKKAE